MVCSKCSLYHFFSYVTIETMLNIFLGVPQSKYAAMAILFALLAVSIAILFGRDPVPLGQKFMFIVLMFVLALPGLLLTLFQLTCMVTGAGMRNQRWWCSAYAWIGTILIILYAMVLVVVAVMSLVNKTDVKKDLIAMDSFANNSDTANVVAKEYFEAEEKKDGVPSMPMPPSDPAPEVPTEPVMPPPMVPEVPAPMMSKPAAPEAFSASEMEPFSSCGAPLM